MAEPSYRANPAGLRAMMSAQFMVNEMRRRADLGRIEAERIAPVDTSEYAFGTGSSSPRDRGAHDGGFHVDAGVRDGKAYARLSNRVRSKTGFPYGVALEFGWRTRNGQHIPGRHIIGNAIDAMAVAP